MTELELPPVERVVAYTPRAGDTIVLQVKEGATNDQVLNLKRAAEAYFGDGIKVMVLGGAEFVGVIQTEGDAA